MLSLQVYVVGLMMVGEFFGGRWKNFAAFDNDCRASCAYGNSIALIYTRLFSEIGGATLEGAGSKH